MTSEEPRPDRCGAKASDGDYCEAHPMKGSDRCRMHGGASLSGEESGQYEHGAFSEHFRSDLSEAELAAFEDAREHLDSPEGAQEIGREAATEALVKYKRSGDTRFLQRFESLTETFNLAPEDALDQSVADAMMSSLYRDQEDDA